MKETLQSFLLSMKGAGNPLTLLFCVFTYSIGGGIIHYLGHPVEILPFFIGFGILFFLLIGSIFLNAYYERIIHSSIVRGKSLEDNSDKQSNGETKKEISPIIFLQAALTVLTIVALLVFLLINQGYGNLPALFFIFLSFLTSLLLVIPPFRLYYSGYGELCEALIITFFSPAIAYLIQTGEFHRLIAMLTFPLVGLYLAMSLANSLQTYAIDVKHNRKNLMIRLGWSNGMNLHNLLILFSYLMLGLALSLGLPWKLTFPGLLTLPLGLYQIRSMINISRGGKPNWKLLKFTSTILILLTTYLISFSLWIN